MAENSPVGWHLHRWSRWSDPAPFDGGWIHGIKQRRVCQTCNLAKDRFQWIARKVE